MPRRALRFESETRAKARDALGFVGLERKADEIVGNLSFGDQKLVAIARLFATECDVLLLDEPTSGVDPGSVETVVDVVLGLRALRRTMCLVEHSVHFVERRRGSRCSWSSRTCVRRCPLPTASPSCAPAA